MLYIHECNILEQIDMQMVALKYPKVTTKVPSNHENMAWKKVYPPSLPSKKKHSTCQIVMPPLQPSH